MASPPPTPTPPLPTPAPPVPSPEPTPPNPPTLLLCSPDDALSPSVAPPPSPFFDVPYVKAGQVALHCYLGCGNAMGLEFEDDCDYYCRLAITTPQLHLAVPLYMVFEFSAHELDCTTVAALLQAVLGGAAMDFFVAMINPFIFRFHVASPRVAEIILDQSRVRHRNYAFSFARVIPLVASASLPPQWAAHTCLSLAQLLQIPEDLCLHFQGLVWHHLRLQFVSCMAPACMDAACT